MSQLKLPGWTGFERQWEAEQVAIKKKHHEEQAASWLKSIWERYPPTAEEWEIIISGIRLCRFVSDLECEGCKLSYKDHTIGWQFPTKICLKDYSRKCKEWGIKPRLS